MVWDRCLRLLFSSQAARAESGGLRFLVGTWAGVGYEPQERRPVMSVEHKGTYTQDALGRTIIEGSLLETGGNGTGRQGKMEWRHSSFPHVARRDDWYER